VTQVILEEEALGGSGDKAVERKNLTLGKIKGTPHPCARWRRGGKGFRNQFDRGGHGGKCGRTKKTKE